MKEQHTETRVTIRGEETPVRSIDSFAKEADVKRGTITNYIYRKSHKTGEPYLDATYPYPTEKTKGPVFIIMNKKARKVLENLKIRGHK